jgi:hypothetical protein
MSYWKTVLSYNNPSEAESDKAFLESSGFDVYLLNANESRNELGAPFHIQLQVLGEQHIEAVKVLREVNPERFGSVTKVAEIEKDLIRSAIRFLMFGLPAAGITFFIQPKPAKREYDEILTQLTGPATDDRIVISIAIGLFFGILATMIRNKKTNH